MKELISYYLPEIILGLAIVINAIYIISDKKSFYYLFILVSYFFLVFSDFKVKSDSFIYLLDIATFFILYNFYLNENRGNFVDINFFIFSHLLSLHLILKTDSFIIFFISLELLSFVFYVLIGLESKKFRDISPVIRYFVIGTISSILLLFSIILIFTRTGSLSFEALIIFERSDPVFSIALFLFIFSLGFKILFIPFQFFMPDVFERVRMPYLLLISLTPKAGVLIFLYKIKSYLPEIVFPVSVFAIISILFSNLAGIYENKVKRILAYSTISHSGFMFMIVLLPEPYSKNVLFYYLLIYFLMKGGIFFTLSPFIKKNEDIEITNLRGIYFTDKIVAISSLIFILSLLSFPPTAGFFAKFYLIYALFKSDFNLQGFFLIILTVISAGYYIKFLNSFFLEPGVRREGIKDIFLKIFILILSLFVLGGGILWKFFV